MTACLLDQARGGLNTAGEGEKIYKLPQCSEDIHEFQHILGHICCQAHPLASGHVYVIANNCFFSTDLTVSEVRTKKS